MSAQTHTIPAAETHHIHHPNYVKIWAVLVALLILSLIGSRSSIRWVLLSAAFGVAVVKAYLVAKNFMHLTIEKAWVRYLLAICLLFLIVLFSAVAPDVMRHRGQHWENTSAEHAVQAGSLPAEAHRD